MSVAAIMLVKDEDDVIGWTICHLMTQVDYVIVSDNASTDGTKTILATLAMNYPDRLLVLEDNDSAYWQARKMTELAEIAWQRCGVDWIVPVDADEMWITDDGRPLNRWLLALAPDVLAARARLFHYVPTSEDGEESNPFERIKWRLAEPASLPKVCARYLPGIEIEAGNHGVLIDGDRPQLIAGGLRVNHYSWRSAEQYARKIVNGSRAYALTDLDPEIGRHWRMWGDPYAEDLSARAAEHFYRYFHATAPPCAPQSSDPASLVFDPAAP
jgi:glycosyltransferase involved in cell wall biosynthesis